MCIYHFQRCGERLSSGLEVLHLISSFLSWELKPREDEQVPYRSKQQHVIWFRTRHMLGQLSWTCTLILRCLGALFLFSTTRVVSTMWCVPIVTAATAWTYQDNGQTCAMVFHKGLLMGDSMGNSLINPNQLWAYGCVLQDILFSGLPVYIKDSAGEVSIPLETVGMNILTTTRTPTQDKLSDYQCNVFTSQREWKPTKIEFPTARWTIEDTNQWDGNVTTTGKWGKLRSIHIIL